jgi:hypothetical protein
VLDATYSAELSYNDSATAVYDSEDGSVFYFDRKKERVEREQELVVEVEVAYNAFDPDSFEIMGVSVTDPPDSFGIETEENYDWPYK